MNIWFIAANISDEYILNNRDNNAAFIRSHEYRISPFTSGAERSFGEITREHDWWTDSICPTRKFAIGEQNGGKGANHVGKLWKYLGLGYLSGIGIQHPKWWSHVHNISKHQMNTALYNVHIIYAQKVWCTINQIKGTYFILMLLLGY